MSKTKKQTVSERVRRRANIRRGVRIGLYEVAQSLAKLGLEIAVPPGFINYTVAVAEGNRRGATFEDRFEATRWTRIMELSEKVRRFQA